VITPFFLVDLRFFHSDMVVGCTELFFLNLVQVSAGLVYSFFDKYVVVDISTLHNLNLLIGKHYFSPEIEPNIIVIIFSFWK
jgi:hypothetical protein